MMKPNLGDFTILTFDCYGTLIDWESGIWDALQPLLGPSSPVTRTVGLELFAKHETALERDEPTLAYFKLLTKAHARIAAELGLATSEEKDVQFGESVPHWPAFADTADALRRLARHYKLAILSNVDVDGFEASNRKLGIDFDAVYTAEDVGSYKPNPANFTYMVDRLQKDHSIGAGQILHTAQSVHHDLVPAASAGLTTAWIDRQKLASGGSWGATAPVDDIPEPAFVFPSLADLADVVDAE